MPLTREDFKPDEGGFLDGVPGKIVDAIFDVASGKYADQVMLGGKDSKPPVVLTLTVDSPTLEKPAIQSFSVGSQDIWEIVDGGKAVKNINNPDKHVFRSGAVATMVVEAMATSLGEGDLEKGQDVLIKRALLMTEAAFYVGGNWFWEVKPITREIAGKSVTSKPPLPVKFLGWDTTTTNKANTVTAAPVTDTSALDKILVDNATGKSEKELKSFAVRNEDIKKNSDLLKSIVSGKKLRELENSGQLTMDPGTKTYL